MNQNERLDLATTEITHALWQQADHVPTSSASEIVARGFDRAYCQVRGYLSCYMTNIDYGVLKEEVMVQVQADLDRQRLLEPIAHEVLGKARAASIKNCFACRGMTRGWMSKLRAHEHGCLSTREAALAQNFNEIAVELGIGNKECLRRATINL